MARLGERWAFEEALVSTLNGALGTKELLFRKFSFAPYLHFTAFV